jgi:hypothetical protein
MESAINTLHVASKNIGLLGTTLMLYYMDKSQIFTLVSSNWDNNYSLVVKRNKYK